MMHTLCHNFFRCAIIFLSIFTFSLPMQGVAATLNPLEMETEDERIVKWDLTADAVTTLNDYEIMEATGNVHLKRGNEYLKADFARYYMGTKWVFLKGNVQVKMGGDEIKAEEAEFDLRSRVGWLKNGEIFMAGPHTYMTGQRIDKHWGNFYTFKDAKITTCDGPSPAWSLTADEAVVEVDGYARLKGSSFQIKNQPVAYSPFFVVPTKTSRQTGFLMPEYGKSSSKGFFYNQPFFWAINDSSDLTVNEHVMEKRGVMHGLQYRASPSSTTSLWLRADWLHDTVRDTKLSDGSRDNDTFVRKNRDRYWLRGMIDTILPDPKWRFKADLDYVSDQDFLYDFKTGINGFNRSRSDLFNLFQRDLQEKDRKRESGFLLSRDWERATVSLYSNYTQNQWLGNGNSPLGTDTSVQRLPQLDAFLHKGRIFADFPLEASAHVQAAYMHRRSGTKGARYELVPRLTLPVTSEVGSIITTAGVRQTIYNSEQESRSVSRERTAPGIMDNQNPAKEDGDSRTLPELSIAGATELSRVYSFDAPRLTLDKKNLGANQFTHIKHSVQPRLEFRYRPYEDQDDNPYYDSDDRLIPQTEIAYSITNNLTRKKETVTIIKDEDGNLVPGLKESYVDLFRLRLEQGYDQREATRDNLRSAYGRRPFGDFKSELFAYYNEYLYLRTKNDWSPYLGKITRHESGVGFAWPTYGSVYAGYDARRKIDEYKRYRPSNVNYLHLGTQVNLPWALSINADYRYDLKTPENSETVIDVTYNHQCFFITGRSIIEPEDKTYQILFGLTGLGD